MNAATIDEYIALFPETADILQKVRGAIAAAAPQATEKMSWRMPTFYLYGNLVHFAAAKKHLGFYPGPSGVEAFKEEAAEYKSSKGTLRFPYNKPIPFDLIAKITEFRVKENLAKKELKA